MVVDERKRFLAQFPVERHSTIANYFYNAVRNETNRDARGLCSTLVRSLGRQLQRREVYGGDSGMAKLRAVIEAMRADPAAALDFMTWVIEREARSPEEKARDKAEQEEEGKRRYMESKPPTQKQLDVLLKLGVDVFPDNRWHASQLIEEHKTW